MPDSRLRAAAYAAGLGSLMVTPVLAIIIWKGWSAVLASDTNWFAGVALVVIVALAVVLTYFTRRGVNFGRGLI